LYTGIHEALNETTEFVKAVEKYTGLKIVWKMNSIDINTEYILVGYQRKSSHGPYFFKVLK